MKHSEVLEIKKRFTKTACSASRLTGCYVTGADKQIKTYIDELFLNLDEEELFKYLEIMKKSLSGTLGKNLLNLSFVKEEQADYADEGDTVPSLKPSAQQSLLGLRDSELKNQDMLEAFYQQVIENYDYAGNYLILLVYDAYDIPVKTLDNIKTGEFEDVYNYYICAICPVNLSKPGLSYHEDENRIANRNRDWVVEAPDIAFLYPAFNDRNTDIHNLLYYVKDTSETHEEFIENVIGCAAKTPSDKQKAVFREMVSDVLNDVQEYDTFEVVKSINDQLYEMAEPLEDETEPEPVMLNKEKVKDIFRKSGIKEEHLDIVEEKFDAALGSQAEVEAANLAEMKKLEVKTDAICINVKQDSTDLIEIRIVDGRKYMMIPMDVDIEVNGIVRRIREEFEEE